MLYLQSASNDFKSLIETINVEKQWDQDENRQEQIKRPSVAWEVRKSMSSPNPALPISSIIAEAVKNASPPTNKAAEVGILNISVEKHWKNPKKLMKIK